MENNYIRVEDNKKLVYVFSSGRNTIKSREEVFRIYKEVLR